MEQATQDEVNTIIAKDAWTLQDCTELVRLLSAGSSSADRLHEILGEMERRDEQPRGSLAVKIGMVRYMLSRFDDALDVLASGTDNKDRHYVEAKCLKGLRRYRQAIEEFQRAADRGWDAGEIALEIIELYVLAGDVDAAEKNLSRLPVSQKDTGDALYLRGLIDELSGRPDQACEAYEQARAKVPSHRGATFHLAYYYDLHGDDARAIELYEECTSHPPVHVGALLNLAVLYEDIGHDDMAAMCLRRILVSNPNHARARLFLSDVEASKTMYFDEDKAKRIAKRNAVLDIPVTDFELSVRARNCLKKMNIRCLGDLVITTETELLAYKNFGETSLREIKEMLTAKGLHLGKSVEEDIAMSDKTPQQIQADKESIRATPLERVELSIRARTAVENLGVATLGELADKTEADLLACKNFGQSSLNEVRQRLTEYDLHLRESE